MDVESAIRTRRTHKAFCPEPVPRELLDELLELARWAPNHHLTNPWRFRVVGPLALAKFVDGMRHYFASLPPDRFPNVVSLAGPLTAGDPEGNERFEFGLDVLVRGLAAMSGQSAVSQDR